MRGIGIGLGLGLGSVNSSGGGNSPMVPANRLSLNRSLHTSDGVGVVGGIPTNRTEMFADVTQAPYNADNTGATSASAAINQACSDARNSGKYVYIPAGSYKLTASIYFPGLGGFTIRGAGDTTLMLNQTGTFAFMIGADNLSAPRLAIVGSPARGDTQITLADASSLSVGQFVQLAIDNSGDPAIPVINVDHATGTKDRSQVVGITAINGNTLTLGQKLNFDLPASLSPTAKSIGPAATGVGLENLKVDNSAGPGNSSFMVVQSQNCWVKNVTSYNAGSYHSILAYCLQCEIRDCRIDQAQSHGNNNSGVRVDCSSNCLLENNTITRCFPAYEFNAGSCGNLITYSFCKDSGANDPIDRAGVTIDPNHAPHNSYDLYEGNYGEMYQADGYFGSVSQITAYRNWFAGWNSESDQNWKCVDLCRFTREGTLGGNILGAPTFSWVFDAGTAFSDYALHYIYRLGFPFIAAGTYVGTAQPSVGNWWADYGTNAGSNGFQELDLDVRLSTILRGNYNFATNSIPAAESLSGYAFPSSLVYDAKPSWWGASAWPPFNPASGSVVPHWDDIPAGARYVAELTQVPDVLITPGGTFTSAVPVTLYCPVGSGVTIRYTTDGSTPSLVNGNTYTTPFTLNASATVKAIAFKTGLTDSAQVSATYTIDNTVATPTYTPDAGTYGAPQNVVIATTTAGATIRYTTDGSTPSQSNGTVYASAVAISVTTTLKAIAYKTGMVDSAVASGVYTISSSSWTPADLTSLVEWHKYPIAGKSNGDNVALWPDSKGAFDATAIANFPTYDTANTGIAFAQGSSQMFTSKGYGSSTYPYTLFAVVKYTAGSDAPILGATGDVGVGISGGLVFRIENTSHDLRVIDDETAEIGTGTTAVSTTGKHLVVVVVTNSTYAFYIDGVAAGSGSHSTPLTANRFFAVGGSTHFFGQTPYQFFNGVISEVGICNAALDSTDLTSLHGYSQTNWGTP